MHCYKVTAVNAEGYIVGTRYAGTTLLSRATRNELMEKFGVKKRDIEIEEVEVPVAKADLLAYLNGIMEESDVITDEATDEASGEAE